MDEQKYKIYKNIMCSSPVIDTNYLRDILHLSENEIVKNVEITKVAESNTTLTIKAEIQIQCSGTLRVKRLFIKTIKNNKSANAYHKMSLKEAVFYQFLQNAANIQLPVPMCFDVYLSEEGSEFLIVMRKLN